MLQILLFMVATVLGTHPATNPNAKLLTVEETENQAPYSVYPERVRLFWDADSQLSKTFQMTARPQWTLPSSDDPNISYGQSVSRNEFGSTSGVFPSPDGSRLAVYRKDESKVTLYPMYDITPRTGGNKWIKYPMAGMDSEKLAVCICDLKGNILTELQVTDFSEERYLTNVTWSPDSKYVFVQVLDREQHNMHLNMYRADNGAFVRTILKEHNDAWVEPLDKLYFIKDSYDFLYRTDNRDGYKNLYLCDTLGVINRVTPCAADVEYLDNDGRYIYYTSAEVSPIENHLFRVRLRGRRIGKPERLTHEEGWHNITLSPDCSKFIDRYSSLNVPGVTAVKKADGTVNNTFVAGKEIEATSMSVTGDKANVTSTAAELYQVDLTAGTATTVATQQAILCADAATTVYAEKTKVCINSTVEAIAGIQQVIRPTVQADGLIYNLAGQPVGDNYKGIVIRNGKKYMVK